MDTLTEHADALRDVVGDLQTLALADLVTFFNEYGAEDDAAELSQTVVPHIVRPYAAAAGTVTAQWYDELLPASPFRATPAGLLTVLPDQRFTKMLRWAFNAPGKAKPVDRVAGSVKRMVADTSRVTVIENTRREHVRWVRSARPGACAFCRMLATRDPVYWSEESALRCHDHCMCVAVPVRSGVYTPPPHVREWAREYRDVHDELGRGATASEVVAAMRKNDAAHLNLSLTVL